MAIHDCESSKKGKEVSGIDHYKTAWNIGGYQPSNGSRPFRANRKDLYMHVHRLPQPEGNELLLRKQTG
jgi:hypothetical protein